MCSSALAPEGTQALSIQTGAQTYSRKKICLFTAEKVRPITVHLYTWLAMPNYHNNYSSS